MKGITARLFTLALIMMLVGLGVSAAQLVATPRFSPQSPVIAVTGNRLMVLTLEMENDFTEAKAGRVAVRINGQTRAVFRTPLLTLSLAHGDLIEIDSALEEFVVVTVKESSPGILLPGADVSIRVRHTIEVLGHVICRNQDGDVTLIAIRGATTCLENKREAILAATSELLQELIGANSLDSEHLINIFFTATPDVTAAFPAAAARAMGLSDVPLFGGQELDVEGAPKLCVRILIQAHLTRPRSEVRHVYLRDAARLRPDLAL